MFVTLASQICYTQRIQRRLGLRVLAALSGHLSSVPSTHTGAIYHCLKQQAQGIQHFLLASEGTYSHGPYPHIDIHIHINKNKSFVAVKMNLEISSMRRLLTTRTAVLQKGFDSNGFWYQP